MRLGSAYMIQPYFVHTETLLTVGTGVQSAISGDSGRVYLAFDIAMAGIVCISTLRTVTSSTGILLSSSRPPFEMTIQEHPQMVSKEWFIIAGGAGISVIVHSIREQPPPEAWGEQ